jgi:hypothetical protein
MTQQLLFPSLETFGKIYARETYHDTRRSLTYRAKIKLHGANHSVCVHPDASVSLHSRRETLTAENDQFGFYKVMSQYNGLWSLAAICETLTFYGEWAGPGVKKGDAIQRTDQKRFFIFAMGIGQEERRNDKSGLQPKWIITDPDVISAAIPSELLGDTVRVLPFEDEEPIFTFDFSDPDQVEKMLEEINASVDLVAEKDPYVSRTFGVDHAGEGFVMVLHSSAKGELSGEDYARTTWKAKTEKHRVKKQKKPAQAKEPLPQSALEFVETFVTEARLLQGLDEVADGSADRKLTGQFIAWITADIEKEAADEIAALPVPFARLKGEITTAARSWFLQEVGYAS